MRAEEELIYYSNYGTKQVATCMSQVFGEMSLLGALRLFCQKPSQMNLLDALTGLPDVSAWRSLTPVSSRRGFLSQSWRSQAFGKGIQYLSKVKIYQMRWYKACLQRVTSSVNFYCETKRGSNLRHDTLKVLPRRSCSFSERDPAIKLR